MKKGCGLDTIAVITGVVFIVLKLVGVIDWSWWVVVSPFLIMIGIVILMLIFGIGITTIVHLFRKK